MDYSNLEKLMQHGYSEVPTKSREETLANVRLEASQLTQAYIQTRSRFDAVFAIVGSHVNDQGIKISNEVMLGKLSNGADLVAHLEFKLPDEPNTTDSVSTVFQSKSKDKYSEKLTEIFEAQTINDPIAYKLRVGVITTDSTGGWALLNPKSTLRTPRENLDLASRILYPRILQAESTLDMLSGAIKEPKLNPKYAKL